MGGDCKAVRERLFRAGRTALRNTHQKLNGPVNNQHRLPQRIDVPIATVASGWCKRFQVAPISQYPLCSTMDAGVWGLAVQFQQCRDDRLLLTCGELERVEFAQTENQGLTRRNVGLDIQSICKHAKRRSQLIEPLYQVALQRAILG